MSASTTPRRRIPRALFVLAIIGAIPTLAGCPKKPDPIIVDAGPPVAPVETQTVLTPMEEDAGAADADAEAGPVYRGPAVNANVARLKACCNALTNQGNQNKGSPEGQMIINAGAQCSLAAKNAGPTGTAPELAIVRGMLAGKTIPPLCAGLL